MTPTTNHSAISTLLASTLSSCGSEALTELLSRALHLVMEAEQEQGSDLVLLS